MEITRLIAELLSHPLTKFVLVLLIVNLVTGILVAIWPTTRERFHLGSVADWMLRALTYVAGALCVQALAYYSIGTIYSDIFNNMVGLCWAFVIAALIGKVIQNLREFGFQLPDVLGDKPKPEVQATP